MQQLLRNHSSLQTCTDTGFRSTYVPGKSLPNVASLSHSASSLPSCEQHCRQCRVTTLLHEYCKWCFTELLLQPAGRACTRLAVRTLEMRARNLRARALQVPPKRNACPCSCFQRNFDTRTPELIESCHELSKKRWQPQRCCARCCYVEGVIIRGLPFLRTAGY